MILFFFAMLFSNAWAGGINQQLSAYGLRLSNEGQWTMGKNLTVQSGDKKIQTLELESQGVSVEMTFLNSIPSAQAAQDADLEYSSILSAYKPAVTPYAGSVSKKLSCGAQFAPRKVNTKFGGRNVRALVGYASERRTFGVCTEAEASMEFAFAATGLANDSMVKLTAFRKRQTKLDPHFWTQLLAEFSMEKSNE